MPKHFSKEYVANLAVRIYLSEIGRRKWSMKVERSEWHKILDDSWADIKKAFSHRCAYCGDKEKADNKLQRDHLNPIQKDKCGIDHPGNIVPSCKKCNNRDHNRDWQEKLEKICLERNEKHLYKQRKRIIENHLNGQYRHPKLSSKEILKLKRNTEALYRKVSSAIDSMIKLAK